MRHVALAADAAGRDHGWKPVLRDYEFDVPLVASFPSYAVTAGNPGYAIATWWQSAQGLTWKADVRAYLFRVEIAQPGAVLGVDGGRELLRAEYALEYDSSKLTHNEQAFAMWRCTASIRFKEARRTSSCVPPCEATQRRTWDFYPINVVSTSR